MVCAPEDERNSLQYTSLQQQLLHGCNCGYCTTARAATILLEHQPLHYCNSRHYAIPIAAALLFGLVPGHDHTPTLSRL